MSSALTSLSGFEQDRASPVVVSFSTSPGGSVGLRYKSAVGSMQLRLAFESVAKLEPMLANSDADPIPVSAPLTQDTVLEAQQFICGELFLEFWSSDAKGFPLPKGCFYGSLVDDKRE